MQRKCFFNLIAGLVMVAFTATGFAADEKISKKLKDKAQGSGNETVSVIVQYHAMPDTAENSRLATLNAQTRRSYSKLKMRALKIKANKLDKLASHPRVKYVTVDAPVEGFTAAARQTARPPTSRLRGATAITTAPTSPWPSSTPVWPITATCRHAGMSISSTS